MSDAPLGLPVVSARELASRQVLLAVSVRGSGLAAAHTVPGQYSRLTLEDGVARQFVIASPPGSSNFEFLLKVPPERVAALTALGPEDRVLVGRPQGAGFPLVQAEGRSLFLIGVGSGIAALRSVVEHLLPRRTSFDDVTLLYGVRHHDELAFVERFGDWAGHSIKVVPVVSRPRPDQAGAGWDGATGYVQHHLPRSFAKPSRVCVFLCGLPEMEKAVAAALLERGVGPDQVHRNW
ncbi:MAG: NAD-binding oxidoreductase [Deltaproteobacteria bacterium]|nr:NAD-binding oxidoreductase [Deltaproteobacteria bacterium]